MKQNNYDNLLHIAVYYGVGMLIKIVVESLGDMRVPHAIQHCA